MVGFVGFSVLVLLLLIVFVDVVVGIEVCCFRVVEVFEVESLKFRVVVLVMILFLEVLMLN